jgi:transcriptional regulator GlxA family with amidase domain
MDQVLAIGGLRFTPDVTKDNCPKLDLLIVPGGWGTRTQIKNVNLLKWISNKSTRTRLTVSVRTGSSLLGKAGLLDGREATTHWRTFDFLRQAAPNATIREDLRFTMDNSIFTSAGISAGIDMALHIVKRISDLRNLFFTKTPNLY